MGQVGAKLSYLGQRVAGRIKRARRRSQVKSLTTAELLAIARANGVSSRSWRAAILARVLAGQVDDES